MRKTLWATAFLSIFWMRGVVSGAEFRAAVVKMDVTPADPQPLVGYAPRISRGINDRLYHRILALDDGTTEFFLISSDFGSISPAYHDSVADRLARECGIDPTCVWWTLTHTHSAPELGPPGLLASFLGERFLKPFNADYAAYVERQLIKGVQDARAQLRPAMIGAAWGVSQANINRRARLTDGRTVLGMNPDGAVDRRIGLLRFEGMDGRTIALVANYPIHGTVMGSQNLLISGDVAGIVSAYVERKSGAPLLFINGAAGNLAPIYSGYANPREGQLDQFEVLLGDRILKANEAMGATTRDVKLQLDSITVETPLKPGLKWPTELVSYARQTAAGEQLVRIPIKFLRINDRLVVWSAPLELFCEISNEIRELSPFPYTFYFGYTNGWLGYLPTAEEFDHQGYEPTVSPFTPAAPRDLLAAVSQYLHNQASR
ncbi:MAG: neutral/alkaline non-lysosomal ceramidase N-terminal domain-containing protein [Opitutaceae bacterium]|nr:neutral/alkaline non-lysosomal ceramidase N-terminal domain-containing protein [Opitutaceae bacterium]